MGLPKYFSFLYLLLLISLSRQAVGQIIFNELPQYSIKTEDSVFFDISATRKIIPLNGNWNVHSAGDKGAKQYSVSVPSVFEGEGDLIFEKKFSINKLDLDRYKAKIVFFGLNYTADVSLNNVIIFRHSGGEFPIGISLPKDILRADRDNIISIKLSYRLHSENTIPLKQRFLFPRNFGGILRDVYIHLIPNISISDAEVKYTNNNRTNFSVIAKIENREFRITADPLLPDNQFRFSILIQPPGANGFQKTNEVNFSLQKNKDFNLKQKFEVASSTFWSPANPLSYKVRFELRRGDFLIDRTEQEIAVYDFKPERDSILFNGRNIKLEGVTYIPSFQNIGSLASYDDMERDIRMIKTAGFNSIRFAKNIPHPYYLTLCRKYGIIAFIEIPVNRAPEALVLEPNFLVRSKNYLTNFLKAYSKYSPVAAIGLGGGYLPMLDGHKQYIEELARIVKKETGLITYASFSDLNIDEIQNVDLYGIELFNNSILDIESGFKELQKRLGDGKIFISEATYTVNAGNTEGYLNEHSFEAQAKYYEDLLNYTEQNPLSGYFINSMFDYTGDFASFTCGYSENNIYTVGLSGFERATTRLSYKVVTSKLNNAERVTIPIGSRKDSAPMLFILFGLALAIFLGILVNSGRKFREDSSRALLRPYNFFADVRDQRIMSGVQSTTLLLIITGISALLLSNLLHYFKMNAFFENLALSFGSPWLMKSLNYLAWNPLMSLIWFMVLSACALVLLILIVKLASSFVHNKVFLSSSYFMVIWSFLPLVLFIPVGIILYRILDAGVANFYIYILLALLTLWIVYRTIKGIYVIFDVNSGSVYFYSIILMAAFVGGIVFYFDFTNSLFSYVELTVQQHYFF